MSDNNKDIEDGVAFEYTPEQIEAARREVEALTPEAYLELVTYLSQDQPASHKEAPGVAFVALYDEYGNTACNLTARANTPLEAAESLFEAIRVINVKYGFSPVRNATTHVAVPVAAASTSAAGADRPPETAQPVAQISFDQSATAKFAVTEVAASLTQAGQRYLRVKGGWFKKHGLPAYKEVLPPGIDLDAMTVMTYINPRVIAPDGSLDFVTVTGKKVEGFSKT